MSILLRQAKYVHFQCCFISAAPREPTCQSVGVGALAVRDVRHGKSTNRQRSYGIKAKHQNVQYQGG